MLLYTKRCLTQYKRICADGLDAGVPKEKFITRLLDGSGLNKEDQEKVMQSVTQKDNYEEVANALRARFSQQECSVMEKEHERQRRVRGTGPPRRERSSMEKVQERQLTRRGLEASPETDSAGATSEEKGVVKL